MLQDRATVKKTNEAHFRHLKQRPAEKAKTPQYGTFKFSCLQIRFKVPPQLNMKSPRVLEESQTARMLSIDPWPSRLIVLRKEPGFPPCPA